MSPNEKEPEDKLYKGMKELQEAASSESSKFMSVKDGEEYHNTLHTEKNREYPAGDEIVHDIGKLLKSNERVDELSGIVWKAIEIFQGYQFQTYQGLCFTYSVKGYEIFVDRKDKSITKSSVDIALMKAVELQGNVSGPKKLKVFGSSYLYPMFIRFGIIKTEGKV